MLQKMKFVAISMNILSFFSITSALYPLRLALPHVTLLARDYNFFSLRTYVFMKTPFVSGHLVYDQKHYE